MVGLNMFAEIQKRKQMGYKKQQAARELGLDNKTVRKYWDMNEREYAQYLLAPIVRFAVMCEKFAYKKGYSLRCKSASIQRLPKHR